jgi:hypothetical protein
VRAAPQVPFRDRQIAPAVEKHNPYFTTPNMVSIGFGEA